VRFFKRGVIAGFFQMHEFSSDENLAGIGHGVAGIDGEVEQHLLPSCRDRRGRARLRSELRLERDVFADEPLEHLGHAGGDLIQVERARRHDLPAAEGEQLAGEVGARSAARSISCSDTVCSLWANRPSA